ncbi:MAG: pyridoxamine 5'-phosphate oxidase family protein [Parvibaculum sp.]|uniref:pyridoxamine 5'-phosphate oxidase family protein n=1 Tax=Parvibaculum sp. TaxID=2024848 RepID=UPI002845F7A0|nr:pyridoxamine 5'-phosphate oxidase family protein [Parvibaculum sp.]MDR3499455.1 pyridoxamine 5'-phosphate oxidase family protein [Parvibaculum sp.]
MTDYQTSAVHRPRQRAMRAHYDRETVHGILDAAYVAHVAFMGEAGPVAMPMFYVRDGESVLLHGSRTSRFMRVLSAGAPLCVTVTLIDGLVLARSAFHHSMNYRSVMLHGQGRVLPAAEKPDALALFIERVERGRSKLARSANAQELKATEVLRVPLVEVVAKVRSGGPLDDAEDMGLPVWAGVIPVELRLGAPIEG